MLVLSGIVVMILGLAFRFNALLVPATDFSNFKEISSNEYPFV